MDSSYIQRLLEDLATSDVDFVLAGGVAVVLQGIARATMDIDAAVSFEEENLRRFLKVMRDNNMEPRAPVPAEWLLESERRQEIVQTKGALVFTFVDRDRPYKQLDVFLSDDLSYDSLRDRWIFSILAPRRYTSLLRLN